MIGWIPENLLTSGTVLGFQNSCMDSRNSSKFPGGLRGFREDFKDSGRSLAIMEGLWRFLKDHRDPGRTTVYFERTSEIPEVPSSLFSCFLVLC